MVQKACIEFDDFGKDNHHLEILRGLKEIYPGFRCTMFAIPGDCSAEFIASLPPWIELAIHGNKHSPQECALWKKSDVDKLLSEYPAPVLGSFIPLFRPPYWLLSDEAHQYLLEKGYKMALHPDDHRVSHYTYNWNLKDSPDLSLPLLKGHGHVQDVCGNGIEESLHNLCQLPLDTQFLFVSEVLE